MATGWRLLMSLSICAARRPDCELLRVHCADHSIYNNKQFTSRKE